MACAQTASAAVHVERLPGMREGALMGGLCSESASPRFKVRREVQARSWMPVRCICHTCSPARSAPLAGVQTRQALTHTRTAPRQGVT